MKVEKKDRLQYYLKIYGNDIVFSFTGSDFIFVLIGYPIWKAYVISTVNHYSLEVIPELNLNLKTINIPDRKVKKKENGEAELSDEIFTEAELKNIEDFFNLIPKELIDLVKLFKDSHWETIKTLIQFGDKLKPLFRLNPAITYLAINIEKFNSSYSIYTNIDYINRVLLSKQKKILEMTLFPVSEQIVKILSKIDNKLLSFENLIQLRKVLHFDEKNNRRVIKFLSHQVKITSRCFDFIINNYHLFELLSHNAVKELLCEYNYEQNIIKIKKIKSYSKYLNLENPLLKTVKNIDKVLGNIKKLELKRREKEEKFPEPPLPGNEYIKPIMNKRELNNWSRRQVNCIHSYSTLIKNNQCYLYKVVVDGEEATLQLNIKGEKVKLGSLLATRNKQVSNSMKEMVINWIKN